MFLAKIIHIINTKMFKRFIDHFEYKYFNKSLGHYCKTSHIAVPKSCSCPKKLFFYENTNVLLGAVFIINPIGNDGKFIMKKNSGAAQNLTVITGNHQRKLSSFFKEQSSSHELDIDKDVVVEEDVWIGANVTLLSGVNVGRGATVGAGSVCIKNVPPYSIVMGNPAKVIGFNFSPNEIIEHEKHLYQEEERLPLELLEKNYKKFYLDRIKDIKPFLN